VVEKGIWRIRTDKGIRERYKDVDTVADIERRRSEWIGHAVRMDQGGTVRKMPENKPEGSRRGRPRLRWLEDVEKGLRGMKVKRQRQQAVDKEEWTSVFNTLRTGDADLRF